MSPLQVPKVLFLYFIVMIWYWSTCKNIYTWKNIFKPLIYEFLLFLPIFSPFLSLFQNNSRLCVWLLSERYVAGPKVMISRFYFKAQTHGKILKICRKGKGRLEAEYFGRSRQDWKTLPSPEKGLPLEGTVWEEQEKMWVPEAWGPGRNQDLRKQWLNHLRPMRSRPELPKGEPRKAHVCPR